MNKNKLAFIICLALGIIGVHLYSSTPNETHDLVVNKNNTIFSSTRPQTAKSTAKIKVQISGAVSAPGIYEVNKGSRVEDLVILAGGLTAAADKDKANLAKNLKDGMLVSIPYAKQGKNTANLATSNKSTTPQMNMNNTGTININTADAQAIQSLKGIGPVLAERIVSYRQQNGNFADAQALLKVPGIGAKLLSKIADQISFN